MNCSDVRPWLDAQLDGELEAVAGPAVAAAVAEHLASCVACQAALHQRRSFSQTLGRQLSYYPASDLLRARARELMRQSVTLNAREQSALDKRTVLRGARTPASGNRAVSSSANRVVLRRWQGVAIAASLLLAVVSIHDVASRRIDGGTAPALDHNLDRELVANHVRALMPGHLMDVVSTDRHTVKPWFEGKIDFSPVVFDFAADSFPLMGGRLDYVAGRTAAALVFRSSQHTINLFVWPDDSASFSPTLGQVAGHNVVNWRRNGLRFGAVSTVAAPTLARFAALYVARDSVLTPPPPNPINPQNPRDRGTPGAPAPK